MDANRRETILKGLNDRYSFLIKNFNIKEAYAKIITWKPYKALACFVYDWSYAPLKRGQNGIESGSMSKLIKNNAAIDNISPEFKMKSHRAFVKNLLMAQNTAVKKKKKVEVQWRGYSTFVEPTSTKFKTKDLRDQLLLALREISNLKKLSPSEENVSNYIFIM